MASKVFSLSQAFADLRSSGALPDGATVMVGGFGLCGIPEQLIIALRDSGVQHLTCISNNAGVDQWGLGLLLQTRQIKKMISSYVGENANFEKQYLSGELEVEFNPQGTLAERIRAGGAGIPAFYTATGAGTLVAEGKDQREFYAPSDGLCGCTIPQRSFAGRPLAPGEQGNQTGAPRQYVLETGLFAHLALIKADVADEFGNLIYNKTARNFNPMMATAASMVIAEVEKIVPTGTLPADSIHTPGVFVNRVVLNASPEKRIEQRTIFGAGTKK